MTTLKKKEASKAPSVIIRPRLLMRKWLNWLRFQGDLLDALCIVLLIIVTLVYNNILFTF